MVFDKIIKQKIGKSNESRHFHTNTRIIKNMQRLKKILSRIDGRGYKEYKTLKGEYNFETFILIIDYVQGDPFAAPSRVRVKIPFDRTGYPEELFSGRVRRIAACDFILREVYRYFSNVSEKEGSGKSGSLSILKPSHLVLDQSAVVLDGKYIEVRFFVGLPAYGRRINAKGALKIFFDKIPGMVKTALIFKPEDYGTLRKHVFLKEDQVFLRNKLDEIGLVAFIANGSILPRESGVSEKPLKNAIPFNSPEELEVTLVLPHAGTIKGMGIKRGITLITGGGYHGKSTLLTSIMEGIYDHVMGDGREYVISVKNTHYLRAEDGRRVEKVNIKPFIDNLPMNVDTTSFSTENASGSTSQAANIQEAIEIGAKVLLLDEDTSATNFMTRDRRMQELINKDKEPITPFLDRARELYKTMGISTILIAGGIGDYLDIADTVIQMDTFEPVDVTEKARNIVKKFPSHRKNEGLMSPYIICDRAPYKNSVDPHKGKKEFKVDAPRNRIILLGYNEIDMTKVPELLTKEQTKTAGYMLLYLVRHGLINDKNTMKDLKRILEKISLSDLSPFNYPYGDFCEVRADEVMKALNRLRTLRVRQKR